MEEMIKKLAEMGQDKETMKDLLTQDMVKTIRNENGELDALADIISGCLAMLGGAIKLALAPDSSFDKYLETMFSGFDEFSDETGKDDEG